MKHKILRKIAVSSTLFLLVLGCVLVLAPAHIQAASNNNSNNSSSSGGNGGSGGSSQSGSGGGGASQGGGGQPSGSSNFHDQTGCDPTTDGNCANCAKGGNGCLSASSGKDSAADANANCDLNGCDIVKKYVNPLINVLSVSIGIIAVISIIAGGIQYASSTGDPQKTAAARNRISKTVFAFVAYAFLYAFLQFLVPGGIFNR